MKRPSNSELAKAALNEMSNEEIVRLITEDFSRQELIVFALDTLSAEKIKALADEEWDAIDIAETDATEARRWANGWYG